MNQRLGQSNQKLQIVVAKNIRARRLVLGISQEELADVCGYHRTYIGAIERGERNITLATLEAIATALNIEAREMLSGYD